MPKTMPVNQHAMPAPSMGTTVKEVLENWRKMRPLVGYAVQAWGHMGCVGLSPLSDDFQHEDPVHAPNRDVSSDPMTRKEQSAILQALHDGHLQIEMRKIARLGPGA